MAQIRNWLMVALAVALVGGVACGGTEKQVADPDDNGYEEEEYESDVMIPEEKFEEIKQAFNSKRTLISRCFIKALDAGEVNQTDKGFVTVGVKVMPNGTGQNARVLQSSLSSKTLSSCVLSYVKTITFTSLPKSLDTSHTYVLERF